MNRGILYILIAFLFTTSLYTVAWAGSPAVASPGIVAKSVLSLPIMVIPEGGVLVSVVATSPTIDSGSTEVLSASISGGSGSYPTITWTGNEGSLTSTASDCLTSESAQSTYTCTIIAPAASFSPDTYTVSVTDSLGGPGTGTALVTINPPISVSVVATSPTIDSGSTEVLFAAISGGSGSYPTITWTGNEGLLTSTVSDCLTSESAPSTYICTIIAPAASFSPDTYTVSVTDSLGGTGTGTALVTINPPISVTTSSATIDNGQSTALSATASGGSGTGYVYTWYSGSLCSGTPLISTTVSPSSTSMYCVSVTDSLLGTPATGIETVTVNPPISVTTSSATIDNGQSTALSATVSGGSGTGYVYTWYSGSSCSGTPLISTTVSPSSTSMYCVSVTDSLLGTPATGIETVTVNPVLTETAQPSVPTTLDLGYSIPVNAIGHGGAGLNSYSYTWTSSSCPGAAASGSGNSSTYTPSGVTTSCTFTFTVNDGLTTSTASTAAITVKPVLTVTAQPSVPTSLEVGQSIPVNAFASGGTGSYSYSWIVPSGASCPGFAAPGNSYSFIYAPTGTTSDCIFKVTANDGLATASASTAVIKVNPGCTDSNKGGIVSITGSSIVQIVKITDQSGVDITGSSDNVIIDMPGSDCNIAVQVTGSSNKLAVNNGTITLGVTGSSNIATLSNTIVSAQTITGSSDKLTGAILNASAFTITGSANLVESVLIKSLSSLQLTGSSVNITVDMLTTKPMATTITGSSNIFHIINGTISLKITGSSNNFYHHDTTITSQTITGSGNKITSD